LIVTNLCSNFDLNIMFLLLVMSYIQFFDLLLLVIDCLKVLCQSEEEDFADTRSIAWELNPY